MAELFGVAVSAVAYRVNSRQTNPMIAMLPKALFCKVGPAKRTIEFSGKIQAKSLDSFRFQIYCILIVAITTVAIATIQRGAFYVYERDLSHITILVQLHPP